MDPTAAWRWSQVLVTGGLRGEEGEEGEGGGSSLGSLPLFPLTCPGTLRLGPCLPLRSGPPVPPVAHPALLVSPAHNYTTLLSHFFSLPQSHVLTAVCLRGANILSLV